MHGLETYLVFLLRTLAGWPTTKEAANVGRHSCLRRKENKRLAEKRASRKDNSGVPTMAGGGSG
jgi:hypothetical protein